MSPIHQTPITSAALIPEAVYTIAELKKTAALTSLDQLKRQGFQPGQDSAVLKLVLRQLMDIFLSEQCGEQNSRTIRALWLEISAFHKDQPETTLEALSLKIHRSIKRWIAENLNPANALDRYVQRDLFVLSLENSLDSLLGNILARHELINLEEEEAAFRSCYPRGPHRRKTFCYDYAFYKMREENALPFVLDLSKNLWPPEFFTSTHNILADWGYVELPSFDLAKEGDLAVYFTEEKGALTARHFGVVSSMKGRVLSKWGEVDAIFEHDFDKVPAAYAGLVSFFSKHPDLCYAIHERTSL